MILSAAIPILKGVYLIKQMVTAFLIVVFALGCASVGTKVSSDRLAQIKKDVTTKAEVEKLLGPPTGKDSHSSGEMWTYSYNATKTSAVGAVGLLLPFGPSGRSTESQTVMIRFDTAGIVRDVAESTSKY